MVKGNRTGLSLRYRIAWRLRYAAVSVFGPAQLGTHDDPQMKLRREKADKLEAGRAERHH